MRDQGGTGFVGLNDYLGANKDPLDAQYNADAAQAHGMGDSLMNMLGGVTGDAATASHAAGAPVQPDSLSSFNTAQAAAQQAGNLGTKFGSASTNGATPFDSALQWGAHGGDYRSLSGYLNGLTDLPQSAFGMGVGQIAGQPGQHNRGPRTPIGPGDPLTTPPYENPEGPGGGWDQPTPDDPWRGTGGGG